jgi:uncharacterized protein
MKQDNSAKLNEIVEFIGEYAGAATGYSPQNLATRLVDRFSLKPAEAEKLALLLEQELNSKFMLATIELNLTFNCNLTCEYCFVHNKSPEDRMDWATAQAAVDLLLPRSYPKVTITLFGGEPLLEFGLIKKIVPYALERARMSSTEIEWALTTNGTLITEEMLDFFARHRINLLLSIDGGPETHDRYRRTKSGEGTWHKIAGLIPLIRQYQSWLGVRMTVSAEAVGSMRQDFRQLVELGINQFIIAPAQGAKCWCKTELDEYCRNLKAILMNYRQLKQAGAALFIDEFETEPQETLGWGCRAGATSLAVAPNGDISPCSKLLGLADEKGKHIVGNVHSGLDFALLAPFQRPASRQPERCKQCSAQCNGGCYSVNYEQTGDHFIPSEESCRLWAVKQEIIKVVDNPETV